MNSKKVLFIAYHFPPDAAVGAIRPAKFVKYLSRLGWQPVVLTIRDEYILLSDSERLEDVEHIPIVRTRVWPTVLQLVLQVRDSWTKQKPIGTGGTTTALISTPAGDALRGGAPPAGNSRLTKYLDSLFETPDKQIGWLIPAVWQAYWLVKRQGVRLVVTSSLPRTTALVGLCLSYLTKISLFTDLRDPWFKPIGESIASQRWIFQRVMGWLEKRIMQRSTRVITTTENYNEYLRSFYADLPESNFRTISNGYDEEDFKAVEHIQPNAKFTVSYLGTFYFGRSPKSFLQALGELVTEGQLDKYQLDVRFIGDVRYAEGKSVEDLILSYDLSSCVQISDAVPRQNALMAMRQSHLLLLLAPDQYYCIPAKAFEYLGSRRNILCISKDGATADLVRTTSTGAVVEPDDIRAIKSAVLRFYAEYKHGSQHNNLNELSKFEGTRLTASLSELLEASLLPQ